MGALGFLLVFLSVGAEPKYQIERPKTEREKRLERYQAIKIARAKAERARRQKRMSARYKAQKRYRAEYIRRAAYNDALLNAAMRYRIANPGRPIPHCHARRYIP
jgi:hypothetical protein